MNAIAFWWMYCCIDQWMKWQKWKNNCHLSLASIMWEYNMFSVWLVTLVQLSHSCATQFAIKYVFSVFGWAAAGLESAFQLLSCLAIISYIMLWFWAKIYCQVGSPRKAAEGLESDGLGSGRQTAGQLSPRWWGGGWWWSSLWKLFSFTISSVNSWVILVVVAAACKIWLDMIVTIKEMMMISKSLSFGSTCAIICVWVAKVQAWYFSAVSTEIVINYFSFTPSPSKYNISSSWQSLDILDVTICR